jgi:TolA-binding protein
MRKILTLFLSFLLGFYTLIQAQDFKKAFKYLDQKKYPNAKVIFGQAVQTQSSASIGYFGLSIVVHQTMLRPDDRELSYQHILKAIDSWPMLDADLKNDFFSRCNENVMITQKQLLENEMFKASQQAASITTWNLFIEQCKNDSLNNLAIQARDKIAFDLAAKFNTPVQWDKFLSEYPKSSYHDQALILFHQCVFDKVKINNSIQGYHEFIQQFPQAAQVAEAQQLMIALEFDRANLLNTPDAIDDFIKKYPQSEQAAILRQKSLEIDYQNAMQFKTLELCDAFVEHYPNSKYTEAVLALRDSLAYQNAVNINKPEAYQLFIENYPLAKQVPLAMNQMGELLYSKEELQRKAEKRSTRQRLLMSATTYRLDKGDSIKKTIIKEVKYDIYGNAVYKSTLQVNDQRLIQKMQYDNAGDRLLKVIRYNNNRFASEDNFTYNLNGLAVKVMHSNATSKADSIVNSTDTLIYDAKRNLIKKQCFDLNGNLVKTLDRTFNAKGYVVEEVLSQKVDSVWQKKFFTYDYNHLDKVVQVVIKDDKGVIINVISNSYDGLGNKISSLEKDIAGTRMTTYFFDERNLLTNEVVKFEDYSGKDFTQVFHYQFKVE